MKLHFRNAFFYFRLTTIGKHHIKKLSSTSTLTTTTKLTLKDLTFISIHVRMTDYADHLKYWYQLDYVTDDYFRKAKQYFRQKFKVSKCILFYVSLLMMQNYSILKYSIAQIFFFKNPGYPGDSNSPPHSYKKTTIGR